MGDNLRQLQEERDYLEKTLNFLKLEIDIKIKALSEQKSDLKALRKDMWENTVHFSNDFARLTEITHYLSELDSQSANYGSILKRLETYRKMLASPYFGRFDFIEGNSPEIEKIYIGLHNVVDSKTGSIFVHDWRAPISSIFYQYELGKASYNAPMGTITGDVVLKRQYKIQNGELKYYFDCRVGINDEILQEVLRGKASAKMRYIVETIQKEQDVIIRDTDNELLIVQGVAGSGKTSIALHRIAFLLYNGINANISSNNILIISPNSIFSKYISSVLPELGEENALQTTFEDIACKLLGGRLKIETRNQQMESLISPQEQGKGDLRRQAIAFKGSGVFVQILDRLMDHYERSMIDFEDIYYNGNIIITRQQIKNLFLRNKAIMPMAKRLKRIESIILEKIHPLRKKRLEKIEKFVEQGAGHELEIRQFSRLLSMKQSRPFIGRIRKLTEVDYLNLYKMIFFKDGLFARLAEGLKLPEDIGAIITMTRENIARGMAFYEDCPALLYLKLKLEGCQMFSEIKQVVIDEAQDYDLMQYQVFKLLFKDVRYTVLGDVNQSIEKEAGTSLYDHIAKILGRRKTVKLVLNKSYRSSYEINKFTQGILGETTDFISFERHETKPMVIAKDTITRYDNAIVEEIADSLKKGYESIAVICKTESEAKILHARLKNKINIALVSSSGDEIEKGAIAITSYLAKGLEFDVVLVSDVSSENYSSDLDKKLLYVICTRALHRLTLFYRGEKSAFLCFERSLDVPRQ